MNPARFFLVHGGDPEAWAKRFDIIPHTGTCDCGRPVATTIPFFHGPLRGLIAPWCPCGSVSRPYCVVHATGDVLEYLATPSRAPRRRRGAPERP